MLGLFAVAQAVLVVLWFANNGSCNRGQIGGVIVMLGLFAVAGSSCCFTFCGCGCSGSFCCFMFYGSLFCVSWLAKNGSCEKNLPWRLREFVIIGDLVAKWLNLLKTL